MKYLKITFKTRLRVSDFEYKIRKINIVNIWKSKEVITLREQRDIQ